MAEQRASIFGDDEADDLSLFKPKPPAQVIEHPAAAAEQVRAVSEAANFRSRDPKPVLVDPPRREPRRHRTGRNVQLNIKARAEAVATFYRIADREHWVLGEIFERAVEALERELARRRSPAAPRS